MKTLTKEQWSILEAVADSDEPFEAIYFEYNEANNKRTAHDLLKDLFILYEKGFISIRQEGLPGFGKEIEKKDITPAYPEEILCDCTDEFEAFCIKKDYLWSANSGDGSAGIPFGIWIDRTDSGKKEWDKDDYKIYWDKTADNKTME